MMVTLASIASLATATALAVLIAPQEGSDDTGPPQEICELVCYLNNDIGVVTTQGSIPAGDIFTAVVVETENGLTRTTFPCDTCRECSIEVECEYTPAGQTIAASSTTDGPDRVTRISQGVWFQRVDAGCNSSATATFIIRGLVNGQPATLWSGTLDMQCGCPLSENGTGA
jgi:hypothetical protein